VIKIFKFIAILVCFATKAVHPKLVSDLTTKDFLACFKRLISQRSLSTNVFTDSGLNFEGEAKKKTELYSFMAQTKSQFSITNFFSTMHVAWLSVLKHFGGLWEAAMKSMKFHLKRVVGVQKLTFEDMKTVLSHVLGTPIAEREEVKTNRRVKR